MMFIFVLFLISLSMPLVHAASLNLNGARQALKRQELFRTIDQKNIDVMFIQETHSDASNSVDWAKEFCGLTVLSHNSNVSGGVGILFSKRCTPISYHVDEILKGRLLKVRAQFEDVFYVFVCVYAPTASIDRMIFLNILDQVLAGCDSSDFLLVGGDFNCTALAIDRNHVEPHLPSRKKMVEVIETNEIEDIWRNFHDNQRQYTWTHCYNGYMSLARLDRFYGFRHQLNFYKKCVIVPVGFSDHSMISCFFSFGNIKPKSAYWHFNTALLEDNRFKEAFIYFWKMFRADKHLYSSLQQWWDIGKVRIRQLCQQYTLNVTRDLTFNLKSLEADIIKLQSFLGNADDKDCIEKIRLKKILLKDLVERRAQGALVRSRFRNATEMDAPSRYFFSLEQKNGQKRLIQALRSESGSLLTETSDIRKQATTFYSDLFKSAFTEQPMLSDTFLNGLPKLRKKSAELLDKPLALEELQAAVGGMQNGRTPGIDGLPVEFYKVFWTVIGQDLLDMLNASISEGKLPLSCRRAVLTLVPKKGDLTDIKQWRPLSLLCIDCRIFSKVLANRLRRVMEEVIHIDQTYCVPGRSIFDNVSLIRDTMEVCGLLKEKVGFILIDQLKAYDRVEPMFLWKVLEAFGFKAGFISMLKVMYSDIESLLKVNGGLGAPFKVERGIRQGCSLSGMLYALSFEPLLHRLRNVLSGVHLQNTNSVLRLSAYADDLVLMINKQEDIDKFVSIFKDFEQLSSAKINWSKSEAFLYGEWLDTPPTLPNSLTWKRGGFKYLGVYLGDKTFIQKNWDGITEKVKGRILKWKWLLPHLSYKGRVLIINNLVASLLWHKLVCVDPPPNLLSTVQAFLVDFFWDRLHWIPQSVLFLPKEEGGQGLIHLASRTAAFRLQHIQRLLTGPEDLTWRGVACAILSTLGNFNLNLSLFLMDPAKLNFSGLPVFYQGLFKVWSLFKVKISDEYFSLHWFLNLPILYNTRFNVKGGTVDLDMLLCQKKILTLSQLVAICGPELDNALEAARQLELRSIRVMGLLLQRLRNTFTADERQMLRDFEKGIVAPDSTDPFPALIVSINDDDCVFDSRQSIMLFNEVSGKMIYRNCVKVLNKKWLKNRIDTPWRNIPTFKCVTPEWRILYKPPLTKKMGDLQWRILHGIVATNSFISVMNPNVNSGCPFCTEKETVFHAFYYCGRLCVLFDLLHSIFDSFHEHFSREVFIFGFKYSKLNSSKGELINFILGNAKMAVYVSRNNKIEQDSDYEVLDIFLRLMKSRIQMEYLFYSSTKAVDVFKSVWCYDDTICSIINNNLVFSPWLL